MCSPYWIGHILTFANSKTLVYANSCQYYNYSIYTHTLVAHAAPTTRTHTHIGRANAM